METHDVILQKHGTEFLSLGILIYYCAVLNSYSCRNIGIVVLFKHEPWKPLTSIAGGSANWYSLFGYQYVNFSEN